MAGDGKKPPVPVVKRVRQRRTGQVDFIALSRDLADDVQSGIYVIQSRKFVYANPFFLTLTGYSFRELADKKPSQLIYHADRAYVRKKAIGSLKGRRGNRPYEYRFIRKDGSILWVMERVSSIEYMGRMATLGSFIEIDDRKHLEEDLIRSEERYRNILDQMYDSYYEVDLAGNFTFVNNSVCINLGYTIEEMAGKNYRPFVPEKDVKKLFLAFNQVFYRWPAQPGCCARHLPQGRQHDDSRIIGRPAPK